MTDQKEKMGYSREMNRLQRDRENALNRLLRDEIPVRPEERRPAQEIMQPEARRENRLRLQIRNRKDSWTEDCKTLRPIGQYHLFLYWRRPEGYEDERSL